MKDTNKATAMKKEIRSLSNYRSLQICKLFISVSLVIASFYVGLLDYAASPVYILLFYLVLPPLLSFILKDYNEKHNHPFLQSLIKDQPFLLNTLKKKYHYNKLNYTVNTISFFFVLFLLCLWQYNLSTMETVNKIASALPKIIITGGVLIRIIGSILYQLKLPYDLSHNKI